MYWPMIWWILPLACMVVMAVMFVLMTRLGGMRCMPRMRRGHKPGSRDGVRRFDEPSSLSKAA
jgi:hypothetical protein